MTPHLKLSGGGPTARDAQSVFEILVREHADMLAAYLRSLLYNASSVDDLFQQTMLVAWRRLDDFDRSRPFAPWLRGIAQRLVLEHHRRGKGKASAMDPAVLSELDERYNELERRPGDTFKEKTARLAECLQKLPEAMREAIDLVYARGMLMSAAAVSAGSSEEALKKRVQRARQLLGECVRAAEPTRGQA